MRTKSEIRYSMEWSGVAIIPAGTPVRPARNLPGQGMYWVLGWPGMDEVEESWLENYGFLVNGAQVRPD